MNQLIFLGLISNLLLSLYVWVKFYKKRILFDNRYGMTISMSSSMIITVFLSMQISFLSPFSLDVILSIMAFTGMIIGAAFGALVRLHAVLSGSFSGVMGSLMGAMSGSVIKNPSLCGLPMDSESVLLVNMFVSTTLGTVILFVTLGLILYSLKV